LSGFIEADGSFSLFINKKSIRLRFSLTQTKVTENNISNEKVMNSLAKFLNVKMYAVENKKSKNLELTVKTQSIINNKILIEYLKLYPL
jgi:LAGLIDADG endonuclease.